MNKEYLLDIIEEIEDLLSGLDLDVKNALLKDKISDLALINHGNMSNYFHRTFGYAYSLKPFEVIKQNIFDEIRTVELTSNSKNKKLLISFYSNVLEDLLDHVEKIVNNDSALEHYKKSVIVAKKNKDLISSDNKDKGPLGLYAFPGARSDKDLPNEPNTELEDKLFDNIYSHFFDDLKLSKNTFNKIQQLIKSKKYSDIFNFYKSGPIYRGMSISKQLSKKLQKNFIYKPRDATSSWTWNKSVAYDFSEGGNMNDVSIVLKASPSKNNIENWLSAKNLYNIDSISHYDNEDEVIVLGDISCEIIYIDKDADRGV